MTPTEIIHILDEALADWAQYTSGQGTEEEENLRWQAEIAMRSIARRLNLHREDVLQAFACGGCSAALDRPGLCPLCLREQEEERR